MRAELSARLMKRFLGGFERTILRRIYGAVQIGGVWGRRNKELYNF
jgi:hypothetical protein